MRSNLLSLQNIAGKVDNTQNRLSTGKKVNSAVENPASYYTAQSLKNRSSDLDRLLDGMEQGIQTLKTALETLSKGSELLALSLSKISQSSDGSEATGATRVSSAEELKKALADDNVENIMVTRSIDFAANEKLTIGTGKAIYGLDETVALNFSITGGSDFACIEMADNSALKNITVSGKKSGGANNYQLVKVTNAKAVLDNIHFKPSGEKLFSLVGDNAEIKGSFATIMQGHKTQAVYLTNNSRLKADVTIKTTSYGSAGIMAYDSALEGTFNFYTSGNDSPGIYANHGTLSGTVNFYGANSQALTSTNGNIIKKGSQIREHTGALGQMNHYEISNDISANIYNSYSMNSALAPYKTSEVSSAADFVAEVENILNHPDPSIWEKTEIGPSFTSSQKKFNEILDQYDRLIKDASYRNVNLLANNDLTVVFNETGSSNLKISGVDAGSESLGISRSKWREEEDLSTSGEEVRKAILQLRDFASRFGNSYQTLTTRENFTQNLIHILSEGAENLVLADMSQESANMLALQTRQQLAVNSLSLASQASRGILKLF